MSERYQWADDIASVVDMAKSGADGLGEEMTYRDVLARLNDLETRAGQAEALATALRPLLEYVVIWHPETEDGCVVDDAIKAARVTLVAFDAAHKEEKP